MPADLVLGVLQVVVPVATESIKGWCKVVTRKHQERKEDDKLVEGLEESVTELSDSVCFLQSLQQGAGMKQDERDDPSLQIWLKKLKELLYDAEDLLDEYATDIAVREVEEKERDGDDWKGKVSKVFTPCCFPHNRSRAHDIKFANKIGRMARALKDHSKRAVLLGFQVVGDGESKREKSGWGWRETTCYPENDQILVGRVDEIRKIKQFMFSTHKQAALTILPIVGMGGMGKTTVAQTIFNDNEVEGYPRVWICVSDNFDVKSILTKIIESIYHSEGRNEGCYWTTLQELESELVKLVKGKRMLLVLDDIWEDDRVSWTSLLKSLEVAARDMKGCAVLITARNLGIKEYIHHPGCTEPVHLNGVEEAQFWQIFEKYAFRDIPLELDGFERKELESTGRNIAKRLKGSPLAAKSIGRLLSSDYTIAHWNEVAGSELWKLAKHKDDIIPILRLSYQYLPAELKQCLVLLSLYPKDYKLCEYQLFRLWMAHNLIPNEKAGEQNLKHLVSRCFLEHDDKLCWKHYSLRSNMWLCDRKQYSMHDLIHDLLLLVSKHDCHLLHEGSTDKDEKQVPESVQHLSVGFREQQGVERMYKLVRSHEKLRTLIISQPEYLPRIESLHLPTELTCLRALAINHCSELSLPESICKLKHLRLLDLSENNLVMLPESIWRLQNLQVLDLMRIFWESSVPITVTRLVNLRYLFCDEPVKGLGKLTLLRACNSFCIQDKSGFGIDELKDLNELRGCLKIRNLELVRSKEAAEQAHLSEKKHLKDLSLEWGGNREERSMGMVDEEVVEALKPCKSLEGITIEKYMGVNSPSWFNDEWLRSLKRICLYECAQLKTLPPSLGTMPFLKTLELIGMPSLKEMRWQLKREQLVGDSSSSVSSVVLLPVLEELVLSRMPNWDGWWVLPEVKELQLCPKLKRLRISLIDSPGAGDSTSTRFNVFGSLGYFTSLRSLYIGDCGNIKACDLLSKVPTNLSLTSLEKLEFWNCKEIASVWLPSPAFSIDQLTIYNCPKLTYIGLGCCPRILHLGGCNQEQINRLLHGMSLANLEELRIFDCGGIQHFGGDSSNGLLSLEEIEIWNCPLLSSLSDLSPLTLLRSLQLENCPELDDLPGINHLTSLQLLRVAYCTKLRAKYEERKDDQGNDMNPRWKELRFGGTKE